MHNRRDITQMSLNKLIQDLKNIDNELIDLMNR